MWNAAQYLKFDDERTRPCRDLVSRIALDRVERAIDLGCGPGNSTRVLRERWPEAEIIGIDSSQDMIAKARQDEPSMTWVLREITDWAADHGQLFDLVFSNAALHWVPNHESVIPQLAARCTAAIAIQMPANLNAPGHTAMREVATSASWNGFFPQLPHWHGREPEFYYDLLSPLGMRLDLWETEYVHVMPGHEAIVEWYKGSGLRPYLNALPPMEQQRFVNEYLDRIRSLFQTRADGRVLFPFRRTFIVAYPT